MDGKEPIVRNQYVLEFLTIIGILALEWVHVYMLIHATVVEHLDVQVWSVSYQCAMEPMKLMHLYAQRMEPVLGLTNVNALLVEQVINVNSMFAIQGMRLIPSFVVEMDIVFRLIHVFVFQRRDTLERNVISLSVMGIHPLTPEFVHRMELVHLLTIALVVRVELGMNAKSICASV